MKLFGNKFGRIDIVFDVYLKAGLKAETRCKRGQRRKVTVTSKKPVNWKSFLSDSQNKTEWFEFPAEKLCEAQIGTIVTVTKGDTVNQLTQVP